MARVRPESCRELGAQLSEQQSAAGAGRFEQEQLSRRTMLLDDRTTRNSVETVSMLIQRVREALTGASQCQTPHTAPH